MTKQSTVDERVVKIFQEHLDNENITIDSELKDLDIDSLDRIEIVMAIEEEFNIEIDDDSAEAIEHVCEAAAIVKNLVGE